jgi:hypothetical protein
MFRRKNSKIRVEMPPLPTELWLVIFDIVIEEGIIRLDQCDYTTFPRMASPFSASARCYQFYDSYYRLRLVCRRFNTLLGTRPWQSFSDSSSLPFPIPSRSLYIDLKSLNSPHFQRLFAEASSFGRLVSLDVDCGRSPRHFLEASAGRAFPNVQRLVLRVENKPFAASDIPFWMLVNCAFPLLVTFVLLAEEWFVPWEFKWKEGDEMICFERLEILYFRNRAPYLGCHFPRLRHASIWVCDLTELKILTRSPHIESLLMRSAPFYPTIDVTSCLRLKLLGFDYDLLSEVVPLDVAHPVDHIWVYYRFSGLEVELFQKLWIKAPKVDRIIIEFSSSDVQSEFREYFESIGIKFDTFAPSEIPFAHGDRYLVLNRQGRLLEQRLVS